MACRFESGYGYHFFMKEIKISQDNWMKICARLDEALEDSKRLDFLFSTPHSPFKNRAEIDEAKKLIKKN